MGCPGENIKILGETGENSVKINKMSDLLDIWALDGCLAGFDGHFYVSDLTGFNWIWEFWYRDNPGFGTESIRYVRSSSAPRPREAQQGHKLAGRLDADSRPGQWGSDWLRRWGPVERRPGERLCR